MHTVNPPFACLLIANRGEIACRIIRTARRLGIHTVAIYSDADQDAQHVRLADRAIRLGPAKAADSYLNIEKVIAAARETGAQAIHPGYGFLSENAGFAQACADAGICFVGPSAEVIELMGSKAAAKQVAVDAGVPTTPGYDGASQDPDELLTQANQIGYPLLIKAVAGGGGRGMRRVDAPEQFAAALQACQREAAGAFGNDHVLLEKYIQQPRHIEFQVFADNHGNAVHLWERECSIQRRYQKIVEECPAASLSEQQRQTMGAAAVQLTERCGYKNAGTVEFLLDNAGQFYFMEMNTRLQVEHPVTEAVTGLDLVEWQLRIAAGEPLPLQQADIPRQGHAIELRLCAEDPSKEFLPAAGPLDYFAAPEASHVRCDTGFGSGDTISSHYDSLLAKLIVHGADRPQAIQRLQAALAQTAVFGLANNLDFLRQLMAHPKVQTNAVDTHFLDQNLAELQAEQATPELAAVAATALLADSADAATDSPWRIQDGWRASGLQQQRQRWQCADAIITTQRQQQHINGKPYALRIDGTQAVLHWANHRYQLSHHQQAKQWQIAIAGHGCWQLQALPLYDLPNDHGAEEHALNAPMPGKILQLLVAENDVVQAGQALLVMEAMKMEYTVYAPDDGIVQALHYQVDEQVPNGAKLLDIEAA